MYVAINKFIKCPEAEAVRKVTAQSAVKFFNGLVCRFGVPNRLPPTTARSSQAAPSCNISKTSAAKSVSLPLLTHEAMVKLRGRMLKYCEA